MNKAPKLKQTKKNRENEAKITQTNNKEARF